MNCGTSARLPKPGPSSLGGVFCLGVSTGVSHSAYRAPPGPGPFDVPRSR